MKKYKQLSLENRRQIKALLTAGHTQIKIAQAIGVHRSTICRELKRNVAKRGCKANIYLPDKAYQKTIRRHREKPKYRRFTDFLKAQTRQWLTVENLSPELISGRWSQKGIKGISHETIYCWIWKAKHSANPQDKNLYKDLKYGARRRKQSNYLDSRNSISGCVFIEEELKK